MDQTFSNFIYLHYDYPQKNILFMFNTNTVFSFII